MAKPNPLQEQLLKAAAHPGRFPAAPTRARGRARLGVGPVAPGVSPRAAARARAEKAERDRALAAARKAQARAAELRAQARQIVEDRKLPRSGDGEYRFTVDGAIRSVRVDDDQRRKLSAGALVIVRIDDRFELLPRVAADKVRERDPGMIVLDHGQGTEAEAAEPGSADDAYYAQFKVPDDLVW